MLVIAWQYGTPDTVFPGVVPRSLQSEVLPELKKGFGLWLEVFKLYLSTRQCICRPSNSVTIIAQGLQFEIGAKVNFSYLEDFEIPEPRTTSRV